MKGGQLSVEEYKDTEMNRQNILELQQTIRTQEFLLKEVANQKEEIITKHHHILEQQERVIMKNRQIIEQKDEAIHFRDNEIQKLKEQVKERNIQLELVAQQLKESEQLVAQFGKRVEELEEQLTDAHTHKDNPQALVDHATADTKSEEDRQAQLPNFRLKWKVSRTRAPRKLRRGTDAVVNGNKVYITPFKLTDTTIHVFSFSRGSWSSLPSFLYNDFSLVVYKNLPTGVGGYACGSYSNKILKRVTITNGERCFHQCRPNGIPCHHYLSRRD